MRRDVLERLSAAGEGAAALALVTRLSDGRQALVDRVVLCGDLPLDAELLAQVARRVRIERSGLLPQDQDLFVRVYADAPRLLIVGAVHVAAALVPMATLAGLQVTLIDPRPSFGSAERFPGVALSNESPRLAMARFAPDSRVTISFGSPK